MLSFLLMRIYNILKRANYIFTEETGIFIGGGQHGNFYGSFSTKIIGLFPPCTNNKIVPTLI